MLILGTILSTIFGSKEVISKGIDLIDDMYTSEEEAIEADADAKVQIRASKTAAKTKLLDAYAPFKVAQRWIAIMFTLNFIAAFWVAVILWANDKDLDGFIALIGVFNIGWIMFAIVSFYFGGGLTESIGSSFLKKKDNK